MRMLSALLVDGYKVGHVTQYPKGTTEVYSNLTARSGRDPESNGIVFFGLQYLVRRYLVDHFNNHFFDVPVDLVLKEYKRRIDTYLGPDALNCDHIEALHSLGYLPVSIKAVPEGSFVPYGVPCMTIKNTKPEFFWVTNMLETLISAQLWQMCTTATSSRIFRQTFEKYARRTVSDAGSGLVPFQGHDFSFRGMPGWEAAAMSGAAHLLSFVGTDTLPAIDLLEQHYGADATREMVGVSVPATEHSVMCLGGFESELETYRRLITDVVPSGIVSIVSDTWDYWNVLTNILPALKEQILARDGKLVIRPDSGVPELIINGDPDAPDGSPARKGSIRILDEIFGSTVTTQGFKTLNPKIGLIYGEQITKQRQEVILAGLAANGYSSDNVVLGIGSYNMQYVTRDTHGFAIKATHGTTLAGGDQPIWKAPKTDGGTKHSAKGLLRVDSVDGRLTLRENVTREEESGGLLNTVFKDGVQTRFQTLAEVRANVEAEL